MSYGNSYSKSDYYNNGSGGSYHESSSYYGSSTRSRGAPRGGGRNYSSRGASGGSSREYSSSRYDDYGSSGSNNYGSSSTGNHYGGSSSSSHYGGGSSSRNEDSYRSERYESKSSYRPPHSSYESISKKPRIEDSYHRESSGGYKPRGGSSSSYRRPESSYSATLKYEYEKAKARDSYFTKPSMPPPSSRFSSRRGSERSRPFYRGSTRGSYRGRISTSRFISKRPSYSSPPTYIKKSRVPDVKIAAIKQSHLLRNAAYRAEKIQKLKRIQQLRAKRLASMNAADEKDKKKKTNEESSDEKEKKADEEETKSKEDSVSEEKKERTLEKTTVLPSGKIRYKLDCPVCKQSYSTYGDYSVHLHTNRHAEAMKEMVVTLRTKLTSMRNEQREEQKKLEEEKEDESALLQTYYCEMCKLNYRQLRVDHVKSEKHRQMKAFLIPVCKTCHITCKSQMAYQHHLCTLAHIKNDQRIKVYAERRDAIRAEREAAETGVLDNFMVLDSVGDGDDIERKVVGEEHVQKVEAVYCDLCDLLIARVNDEDEESHVKNHCQSRMHVKRYLLEEAKKKKGEEAAKDKIKQSEDGGTVVVKKEPIETTNGGESELDKVWSELDSDIIDNVDGDTKDSDDESGTGGRFDKFQAGTNPKAETTTVVKDSQKAVETKE